MFHRVWLAVLRFCFQQFYTTFAFTYDFVSASVSRGHWRAWTRAAIPRLVGTRVLEIPCGTGNLLIDLVAAGYAPVGVDLSSAMLRLAQKKNRRVGARLSAPLQSAPLQSAPLQSAPLQSALLQIAPLQGAPLQSAPLQSAPLQSAPLQSALLRARAQQLPFADRSFDSIVMTFPPGFIYDRRVLAEFHRLLADDGRLIWIDAGRLLPRDFHSRLLNRAFDAVGGDENFARGASDLLARAGFAAIIETVRDEASGVMVAVAEKKKNSKTVKQSYQ